MAKPPKVRDKGLRTEYASMHVDDRTVIVKVAAGINSKINLDEPGDYYLEYICCKEFDPDEGNLGTAVTETYRDLAGLLDRLRDSSRKKAGLA